MRKNIAVIDAQGNKYEATYPKRAKGLVKNGRARFVDETTICLACPPEYTEGKRMNASDILTIMEGTESGTDSSGAKEAENSDRGNETAKTGAGNTFAGQSDKAYIMAKIDQILADTQYLTEAVQKLGTTDAVAVANLVEAREKTNQSMIRLLEKMLDDQSAAAVSEKTMALQNQKLDMMLNFLRDSGMDDEYVSEAVSELLQKLL